MRWRAAAPGTVKQQRHDCSCQFPMTETPTMSSRPSAAMQDAAPRREKPQPDQVLDTSGLTCPLPILKAKKAMKGLSKGEVLQVLSTDPGSVVDFEAFCGVTGNPLLAHHEEGGVYVFFIERG